MIRYETGICSDEYTGHEPAHVDDSYVRVNEAVVVVQLKQVRTLKEKGVSLTPTAVFGEVSSRCVMSSVYAGFYLDGKDSLN